MVKIVWLQLQVLHTIWLLVQLSWQCVLWLHSIYIRSDSCCRETFLMLNQSCFCRAIKEEIVRHSMEARSWWAWWCGGLEGGIVRIGASVRRRVIKGNEWSGGNSRGSGMSSLHGLAQGSICDAMWPQFLLQLCDCSFAEQQYLPSMLRIPHHGQDFPQSLAQQGQSFARYLFALHHTSAQTSPTAEEDYA